jgi:hypothetical protein
MMFYWWSRGHRHTSIVKANNNDKSGMSVYICGNSKMTELVRDFGWELYDILTASMV